MRHVKELTESYDSSKASDRKKIALIEWFQQHPGKRFDRNEVHSELGSELEIGEKQVGNYLNDLAEDEVLEKYGSKRISYQLREDIVVPRKFQIKAGFDHIAAVFDVTRWGLAGFTAMLTFLWGVMTIPFWFFWISLNILPSDSIGPLHQSEILTVAISMTVWLVVFVLIGALLYYIQLRRSY